MAILSVWQKAAGRSGAFDRKGVRNYVRTFGVLTTDEDEAAATVRLALGIPRLFDFYVSSNSVEIDLGSLCINVRVEQDGIDPFLWEVTCDYSSEYPDPERTQENPLERRTKVTWGFARYTRPMLKDADDVPVVNSAGDAFDPPIEIDDFRLTLVLERWEATHNEADAITYQDAVNSDPFYGQPAGVWKVQDISAVEDFQNGQTIWQKRYTFEGRREGWRIFVLDQGYQYVNGNGALVQFEDGEGRVVSQPQLLDGQGANLGDIKGADGTVLVAGTNSTLAIDHNANTTALSVVDTGIFPPPPVTEELGGGLIPSGNPPFYVRVGNDPNTAEHMKVVQLNADPADTFKVVRGVHRTTAAAHAAGVLVQLLPVYRQFRAYKEIPFAPLNL